MAGTTTDSPDIKIHRDGQDAIDDGNLPFSLPLELTVRDRETIAALWQHEDGTPREQFALESLKIGALALRQASGALDATLIRQEADAWMKNIQAMLREHQSVSRERLDGTLREYFDPKSGRFNERAEQLVRDGGELQQLLAKQIGGEDSQLAKTLTAHVGKESALVQLLDPRASEGLFTALRTALDTELLKQRERLLKEFSLDEKDGALSRLVRELTARHGKLEEGLGGKIDAFTKELSLDEENSALSRLVRNVDRAQRTISNEFSLDNETSALSRLKGILEETQGAIHENLTLDNDDSPLARLKRELHELLDSQGKKNREFQEEVKVALGKIVATREEAARGTQHGNVFEDVVCEFVLRHAQAQGDIATPTGNQVGLIRNCKKGDFVIELGADSAAPGAKIAIEAKEDKEYDTTAKAIDYLEIAKKNRGASVGLFIFSVKTAPQPMQPMFRQGNDVFVVWDAEDPSTDSFLTGGLFVARALCLNQGQQSEARAADFEAIERAVLEIEKQASRLDDISKSASSIESSCSKILDVTRKSKKAFDRQIESLREHLEGLEGSFGGSQSLE